MKIKILKISNSNTVEFSTNFGTGVALCKNIAGIKEGEEYSAEIDVDSRIELNSNALIVPPCQYLIRHDQSKNEIQGLIEDVDDDGMIYLRLAADCLVMIENQGVSLNKGAYLLLTLDMFETRITLI